MNPNLGRQFQPFALDDEGVARYKQMSRDAFAQARAHRMAGNLNAADEAMRYGAAYRETARLRDSRGAGGSRRRYGDMPRTRVLP